MFNPVAMRTLYNEVRKDMNYVLTDYIPAGSLTALTAYAKVGKSTWAYALAAAVARGVAFMGRSTKKGAVLVIAAEEHPREVRVRLERFGVTAYDPVAVHSGDFTTATENFDNFAKLKVWIKDSKAILVIVDTIGHVWNVVDENNTQQVLRALKPWLRVAREAQRCS